MIDFLLGLYFAGLFVRGWLRGFAKEAMDLAGLLFGVAVAFRLSGPAGEVISAWAGVSDLVGRLVGAIAVFVLVGIVASIAAHLLHRLLDRPGLRLSNRLLGAGLATAWALFVATLVLSLLSIVPLPGALADQVASSRVAATLTDPEAPPQQVFQAVSGDRMLGSLLSLERLLGREQIVLDPEETVTFPPADEGDVARDHIAAGEVYRLLNQARIEAGLDPLAWSEPLADVAAAHALDMYVNGYFAHTSPTTGTVADRVRAAGLTYRLVGENLALAPTVGTAHQGLMDSPGHRANILHADFTSVGVGVVEGPLGLMVVQVFHR